MKTRLHLLLVVFLITGFSFSIQANENLPFKPSSTLDNAIWYTITSYSGYYAGVYPDKTLSLEAKKSEIETQQLWCFIGNNTEGFLIYNQSDLTQTIGLETNQEEGKDIPVVGGTQTKWYIRTVTNATLGTMYSICPIESKDNASAATHWNNTDPKNTTIKLFPGANGNIHSHWSFAPEKKEDEEEEEENPFIVSESIENAVWYRIKSFAGVYAMANNEFNLLLSDQSEDNEQQFCFMGDNETGYIIYNKSNTELTVGVENEVPKLKEDDGTRWYIRQLVNATKGKMYAICPIEYKDQPSLNKNWNNFDGKNKEIAFWAGGPSNNHSHWNFEKYVPREYLPFTLTSSMQDPKWYRIQSFSGYYANLKEDATLGLVENVVDQENQLWCFVGTRNDEGVVIYNKSDLSKKLTVNASNIPLLEENAEMKWYFRKVTNADKGTMYSICPIEFKENATANKHWNNHNQTNTEIRLYAGANGNKHSHWTINEYRSYYQTKMQIYNFPCGSRISGNGAYLETASIEGVGVHKPLEYKAKEIPSSYYVMHTESKPVVEKGTTFDLLLKGNIDESGKDFSITNAYIYCDWDRDGDFETILPVIEEAMEIRQTIEIPENALSGKTRIRVRYMDKSVDLNGAENDIKGMIYDFVFTIIEKDNLDGRIVNINVNENKRGKATILTEPNQNNRYDYGSLVTVKAEAYGTSVFRYWKQDNLVVSENEEYTFTVAHDMNLTAYFTPNTGDEVNMENVDNIYSYQLYEANGILNFLFKEEAVIMELFSMDGTFIQRSYGNQMPVRNISKGIYIVRVYTANHVFSKKIHLFNY